MLFVIKSQFVFIGTVETFNTEKVIFDTKENTQRNGKANHIFRIEEKLQTDKGCENLDKIILPNFIYC